MLGSRGSTPRRNSSRASSSTPRSTMSRTLRSMRPWSHGRVVAPPASAHPAGEDGGFEVADDAPDVPRVDALRRLRVERTEPRVEVDTRCRLGLERGPDVGIGRYRREVEA